MERDELLANLRRHKIDDSTYDRIEDMYPVAADCPTCAGQKTYRLNGETHNCDCDVQRLLARHYYAANIGREYHDICLDHFEGPDAANVVPAVRDYIATFDDNFHYGIGLTFAGPLGTGKTFAATCVLKELVKRGRDVYSCTFEQLINVWGQSYQDAEAKRLLEKRLKSAEVLALDELRSDGRNMKGFLANGLDSVIRHRVSNLLPTLVTTNMSKTEEQANFLKAYSLLASRNIRIETHGQDRRQNEVRQTIFKLVKSGERRPVC